MARLKITVDEEDGEQMDLNCYWKTTCAAVGRFVRIHAAGPWCPRTPEPTP